MGSIDEVLSNAKDAFTAVLEAYQDLGRELPLLKRVSMYE